MTHKINRRSEYQAWQQVRKLNKSKLESLADQIVSKLDEIEQQINE